MEHIHERLASSDHPISSDETTAPVGSKRRVWPPFNHDAGYDEISLHVSRGHDSYLECSDGLPLLDGISGLWNVPLGYSNEPIKEAIRQQLEVLPSCSLIVAETDIANEAASLILHRTQMLGGRVFFTNDGSEGVETAIKLARHYFWARGLPQKRVVLSCRDSYHGMTMGALAVTGVSDDKWQFGSPLPDVYNVATPSDLPGGAGNKFLSDFEAAIRFYGSENIAAIIVEPVFAVAGVVEIPGAALQRLADICAAADILLVVDEVTTGVYRASNEFLVSTHHGVSADIVVLAKALTNGYVPLGATVAASHIFESVERAGKPFMHGHTFSGNPLAMAACKATLEQVHPGVSDNVARHLSGAASTHLTDTPAIAGYRLCHAMLGVDINVAGMDPERISQIAKEIRLTCRKQGYIVRPTYGGRTFNFFPMYVSSVSEMDDLLACFAAVARTTICGAA